MTRSPAPLPAALAVVLLLACASRADDHELRITLAQVPDSVTKAAAAAVPGANFRKASVEAVLVYEVMGAAAGTQYEVEVTAEGQVIEVEQEDDGDDDDEGDDDEAEHELAVPLSALPAKVRAAALAAVPDFEPTRASVEAVLVYELEGAADGQACEVEVSDEGRVLEVERGDDDDD